MADDCEKQGSEPGKMADDYEQQGSGFWWSTNVYDHWWKSLRHAYSERTTNSQYRKVNEVEMVHLMSISEKPAQPVQYRRWKLHVFTSILVLVQLMVNITYLVTKIILYIRRHDQVFHSPWLLPILLCECAYFLGSVIAAVDHCLPELIRPKPVVKEDQIKRPTVDIFLPCCKEPVDVIRDSIRAALSLTYPKDLFRILVLDDGGDDQLEALCQDLQATTFEQRLVYLRRKKVPGVPHHFKCGNLNYGLEHSVAEYVVMMDADMILHPTFLQELIPYIVDSPEVAFVQIPQSFYNLPLGDPLNDASVMGYDRALVRRDGYHGSATCIGTGAIFRRQSLDKIGGFQPQSITEDTMTAYVLFNHGYRSVYLNEKLQMGLTPWTFEGYIKQRQRWEMGAIQQFAASWKDMLGPKSRLNLVQKCLYFWHTGYYFVSIFNIILMITLLCCLAFRLDMVVGNEEENKNVCLLLAVYFLLWRIGWSLLWVGVPQPIQSRNRDESHFWWMTPFFFSIIFKSCISFKSTYNFVPTSSIDRAAASASTGWINRVTCFKQVEQFKHLKPHILFATLACGVVAWRVSDVVMNYGLTDCRYFFTVIGLSFFLITTSAHMLLPVFYILWPTNYKPEQRKSLLKYDAEGVPRFSREDCLPKFHRSVWFYEFLAYASLAFWMGVVLMFSTNAEAKICRISGAV
ncbi:hypothetical protein R1flu_004148 [Riccia fluitans]|uniref:Glycosyltransferase 2-like domain-containing protein n=1 Tax=Riccia fluitans TaxID=41844 RepID=A0ABD1YQF7_9MARC